MIDTAVATVPDEWACGGLPLTGPGTCVDVDSVVAMAEAMFAASTAAGDLAPVTPVCHWAHMLKLFQAPDGAWPLLLDARTGRAATAALTLSPVRLFRHLARLFDSTEYDLALEIAGEPPESLVTLGGAPTAPAGMQP